MKIHVIGYSTPKLGEDVNQDSWASFMNEHECRVAVADGVSRSFEPQKFAEDLVQSFVAQPPQMFTQNQETCNKNFLDWVKPIQEKFEGEIDWSKLEWPHDEIAETVGACSTIITLRITENAYEAWGIGDSNLIIVSPTESTSFPITNIADFGRNPFAVSHLQEKSAGIERHIHKIQGEVTPGTVFVLASDKVALHLLENSDALEQAVRIMSRDEAENFIAQARDKGLKNDDETIVVVHFDQHEHEPETKETWFKKFINKIKKGGK